MGTTDRACVGMVDLCLCDFTGHIAAIKDGMPDISCHISFPSLHIVMICAVHQAVDGNNVVDRFVKDAFQMAILIGVGCLEVRIPSAPKIIPCPILSNEDFGKGACSDHHTKTLVSQLYKIPTADIILF